MTPVFPTAVSISQHGPRCQTKVLRDSSIQGPEALTAFKAVCRGARDPEVWSKSTRQRTWGCNYHWCHKTGKTLDLDGLCTFSVYPSNLCHVFIEMRPAWSGMGCSSDDPRWQCRGSSASAVETESPFSGHRNSVAFFPAPQSSFSYHRYPPELHDITKHDQNWHRKQCFCKDVQRCAKYVWRQYGC